MTLYVIPEIRVNKFIRHRKANKRKWMKQSGEVVKIKNMNTKHIINSLRMLERINQTELKAYKGLREELLNRGINEDETECGFPFARR